MAAELKFDPETGAPVRDWPVTLVKDDKVRTAQTEGEYTQALYDGYKEPETKTEARAAEKKAAQNA